MLPVQHPDAPKAIDAALRASELITQRRKELSAEGLGVQSKSSAVDPVTVVDKESEQLIARLLREGEPDVAILGEEEQAGGRSEGERRWVVDPIDGTVNFLYDSQAYAVSIALEVAGEVQLGVVVDVPASAAFVAAKGEGSWRRREGEWERLQCSQPNSLARTLLATGFAYDEGRRKAQGRLIADLLGNVRDIRRFGSAALDCCRVAEGSVDAYFEHGLNRWDFAAGVLIAAESSCFVEIKDELVFMAAPSVAAELRSRVPDALEV